MTERVFDWVPSTHFEQNARYRLAGLDCYATGGARNSIKRSMPLNLNQLNTPGCSGFGCGHALAASPKAAVDITPEVALQLYYQAQREDEWPGEDYDGSSVNGAMHAARTLGRIKGWRWASTPEEIRHGLSYHGAAEAGSLYYDNMLETDLGGYIHAEGGVVGGHAYCISGFRQSPDRPGAYDYWMDNSWGEEWGVYGGAWITDTDAHFLWFSNEGEIAFPIK